MFKQKMGGCYIGFFCTLGYAASLSSPSLPPSPLWLKARRLFVPDPPLPRFRALWFFGGEFGEASHLQGRVPSYSAGELSGAEEGGIDS